MLQGFVRNAQLVLTKPSIASFDTTQPFANWNVVLIVLGIASVVRGLLGAIAAAYITTAFLGLGTTSDAFYSPVSTFFGTAISTFISFFIGVGILYLIARLFQGTGSFLNYTHALALIIVPVYIADAVLGLIPILGGLVSFVVGIYAIYLAILATASTHRLPMNRAVWVVLIPVIAAVALALCFIVVIGAALVALTHR